MEYVQLSADRIPLLAERLALFRELLERVATVARESECNEASKASRLLSARAVLRVPFGNGHQIAYYLPAGSAPLRPAKAIFITLVKSLDTWNLLPDDVARPFTLPSALTQTQGAYFRSTHSIYLAADGGLTAPWLALLLLHEAIHALDHDGGRWRGRGGWRAEWHVRNVEYRVLVGLYGTAFVALLDNDQEQEAVVAQLESGTGRKLYEASPARLSEQALDEVFGTVSNRSDSAYRRALVSRSLIQHALRRKRGARYRRVAVT